MKAIGAKHSMMECKATPPNHALQGPKSPLPICKKSPKMSPAVCRSEPRRAQRLVRAVQTAATTLEAPSRSERASFEPGPEDTAPQEGPDSFATKLKKVWDIFFPEQPSKKSKDIAARRLRMILVADRCGLSDEGFAKIKASVVEAVQEYVEVCDDKLVNVNIKNHPELGTVYSVDVPVQRIRPKLRVDPDEDDDEDGDRQLAAGTFQWQENDMDSDPSARFPYGC